MDCACSFQWGESYICKCIFSFSDLSINIKHLTETSPLWNQIMCLFDKFEFPSYSFPKALAIASTSNFL